MQNRLIQQLEKAEAFYHQGDFYQGYLIFKRFYDRLPFALEEAHVLFIHLFARCLGELGRTPEIKFYLNELERNAHRNPKEAVKFIQGILLCQMAPPDFKRARALFEDVLRGEPGPILKARCKIQLALTYERLDDDYRTCRKIIDSIDPVNDRMVVLTVEQWKCLLLIQEGKYPDADKSLTKLLGKLEETPDWYLQYAATVVFCLLHIKAGQRKQAIEKYVRLEQMLQGKEFFFSKRSLDWLEGMLRPKQEDKLTSITVADDGACFAFEDLHRTVKLDSDSNIHRMLRLFSEKRIVTKESIVEHLYNREYSERHDDKLVYYHIHALRKFLVENGLSDRAIIKDRGGYAIAPKVLAEVESEN